MATTLERVRPTTVDHDRLKAQIRARARALGFDVVGFAGAGLPRGVQSAWHAFLAAGRHGEMAWLARDPERRASPQQPVAGGAKRDRAGAELRAGRGSARGAWPEELRRDLGLRAPSRLSRADQGPPQADRGLARRRGRLRGQGLRRHRARAREAARPGGRARLAGQAHQPRLARARLLAVPRRDLDRPRARPRPARARPLRLVPRLPRGLPDQGLPGALPARRAALYLLPHDRASGPHRPRVPRSDRQSHLRLRRLPRGLPVEQVRARGERSEARGAGRPAGAALGRARAARRCRLSQALRRLADQAQRPRPLRAQRADRDRQQRRCRRSPRVAEERLADPSPLVRAMAVWALAQLLEAPAFARLAARHGPAESDPEVAAEWGAAP